MKGLIELFVREKPIIRIITQRGVDAIETRGNIATLADRGNLPCMWWMDSPDRIIVGADKNNPPIPYCKNCPITGGPIVKAGSIVPSRAFCEYFGSEKYYYKYPADDKHPEGGIEWCWGQNVNPNGWGEATWEFTIPKRIRKRVKSIKLEISDKPTSNGRLHSNKSGDLVRLSVNGRLISQYVLDKPTEFYEYIWRDGTHQPLDPEKGGKLLDLTDLIDPSVETLRITIWVGPFTKWDISKVALHVQISRWELTELSWALIGFVLGLIAQFLSGFLS